LPKKKLLENEAPEVKDEQAIFGLRLV